MKLTEKAIGLIDNLDARFAIGKALRFTETWVRSLIQANKENGPLTTASALKVIREVTGLEDSEILEDVAEPQETNN